MKSDAVKTGMQQAPHRSLFNALGMTEEEMRKPLVGIVSSYNEIVPGHMNLDKIVDAVKLGVAMAGGTPVVFPAIAVCDGIAMGHIGMKYSLVTRDLIADSTECMALAHQFDALVMVPNCDKNVPGLLMAAARINVPTVFVSGGPMLAGHVKGHKTSLSSMFEAVGAYAAGNMSEEDVKETLNLEEIKEIGHDGSFVTSDYTLENYRDLYSPRIGERNAKNADYFKESIDKEIARLLKTYDDSRPEADAETMDRVRAVLEKSGTDMSYFEK